MAKKIIDNGRNFSGTADSGADLDRTDGSYGGTDRNRNSDRPAG